MMYLHPRMEVVMLEQYYVRPRTVDRIRGSWIGEAVEKYVAWLAGRGYKARSVLHRVPILMRFGQFAADRGATSWEELPAHTEPFVSEWVAERAPRKATSARRKQMAKEVRGPIEQMLGLVLPGYVGSGRSRKPLNPFQGHAPDFFVYLREEKGLKDATIKSYRHHLRRFATYLERINLNVADLSPAVLSAFVAEYGHTVDWSSLRNCCGQLRVLLRYLYREGVLPKDLSGVVEPPQTFRYSTIPRSISWEDVQRVLACVDRRTPAGKRDYAILLLLVTYGLRGYEVAGLTLDDIDWRNDRLRIPERKAGHSTAYPLSSVVGEAIIDYLQHGRPETKHRRVFLRSMAPVAPISPAAVSSCAGSYLRKAGVRVPRPGSHTLRHTCVQRLVDADFPLKTIGDYVGHRSPSSTQIYSKVAIEALRQVAMGDGEEVL
jgi:site-specific recombinase XerD